MSTTTSPVPIKKLPPGTEGTDLPSKTAKTARIRSSIPDALPADGSAATVKEVVDWFRRAGFRNGPRLSTVIQVRVGIELSQLAKVGKIRRVGRGLYARNE